MRLRLRYLAGIMWGKESLKGGWYLEKSNIIEKELAENKLARHYCWWHKKHEPLGKTPSCWERLLVSCDSLDHEELYSYLLVFILIFFGVEQKDLKHLFSPFFLKTFFSPFPERQETFQLDILACIRKFSLSGGVYPNYVLLGNPWRDEEITQRVYWYAQHASEMLWYLPSHILTNIQVMAFWVQELW